MEWLQKYGIFHDLCHLASDPLELFAIHFYPIFSFAIESYICETDFILGPSQKYPPPLSGKSHEKFPCFCGPLPQVLDREALDLYCPIVKTSFSNSAPEVLLECLVLGDHLVRHCTIETPAQLCYPYITQKSGSRVLFHRGNFFFSS